MFKINKTNHIPIITFSRRAEMENTPKPGEVWEKLFKYGDSSDADSACMFIYEKDGELWGTWMGAPWGTSKIEKEMLNGQDGWRRVYSPK